jgi:predicted  nucleic acid-binding Zn-ribbon protein
MPHVCTNCDRTFPDGSKEMLSGCPDCGGNKFQYRPAGGKLDGGPTGGGSDAGDDPTPDPPTDDASPAGDAPPPRDPTGSRAAETVSSAASTLRDLVGASDDAPEPGASGPDPTEASAPDPTKGDTADPTEAISPDRNAPDDDRSPGDGTPQQDPAEGTAPTPDSTRTDGEVVPDSDPAEADEGGMADTEDAAQASARSSVVDPGEIEDGSGPGPDAGRPDTGRDTDTEPTVGTDRGAADGPAVGTGGGSGVDAGTPETSGTGGSGGAGGADADVGPSGGADPDRNGSAGPDAADANAGGDSESNLSELREELNDQFESIKIVEPGQYELNLMELYDRDEYIISLKEDGRYVIEVPETWRGNTP